MRCVEDMTMCGNWYKEQGTRNKEQETRNSTSLVTTAMVATAMTRATVDSVELLTYLIL